MIGLPTSLQLERCDYLSTSSASTFSGCWISLTQPSASRIPSSRLFARPFRMKFGKLCEETCARLQTQNQIPSFPYKSLKKCLKQAESEANGHLVFCDTLWNEIHAVDKAWQRAVRSVLKSKCSPRISVMLSHMGVARWPVAAAPALAEWASLARTGLRKIKKKYNKRLGAKFGRLEQARDFASFAFEASPERTEIQALASTSREVATAHSETQLWLTGGTSELADPRSFEPGQIECPVCMETLFEPVAPQCGHPVCRACYEGMLKSKVTMQIAVPGGRLNIRPVGSVPQCPLCREPAPTVAPMAALAKVCKASDPVAFAVRRKREGKLRH